MAALRRYELHEAWNRPFSTLSGGQQARFQILMLELSGATMLLLDEPTDNLDLASAEALEAALAQYSGTVLVVTHDRWLMRSCDRFLLFGRDCSVRESNEARVRLIRPAPIGGPRAGPYTPPSWPAPTSSSRRSPVR